MEERHFFAVHTFISEETRKAYLTPPEKRNPPEKRRTEREWAEFANGKYARCMSTWVGNEEFFYCHWIAKSEQDVYRQLEEFELEGTILQTMVHEVHQFMSAYRNSSEIIEQFPENGTTW